MVVVDSRAVAVALVVGPSLPRPPRCYPGPSQRLASVLVHYYSWSWSHCLNYYRTLSTGVVVYLNTRGGERTVDLAFAEHAPGFFSASFFL